MSRRVFLRCPRLGRTGCEHGFGTRHSKDRPPRDLVTVRQVHGTRALEVPSAEADPEADALFTRQPDLAVAVRTADCVPILLAACGPEEEPKAPGIPAVRGVAAVHAGWRGSAAGIVEATVGVLAATLEVSPADMLAVIGPHIGACCYEVDAPVVESIGDPEALRPAERPGHYFLDLFELNRRQLQRAGVPEAHILRVPACTSCDPSFDSYRRDGTAGRMLHYVRMPSMAPGVPS